MLKADYHMHCEASEDSEVLISALCAAAVRKGLNAIAVTDHVELVDYIKGEYDIAARESWRLMNEAIVPENLRLARGIELGEPCFNIALADELVAAHPYDFVLASQHRMSEAVQDFYFIDYSSWSEQQITREMEDYFKEVLRVVKWNKFDSLAHLTYPFRYLPAMWRNGDYSRWQTIIDELLGTLAENGKALEINTSGIRKGQGVTSPDLPLVRRFYELGGQHITIGSDAHREHEVGADLDVGVAVAKDAGFQHVTIYFERQPQLLPID